jgi:hypothetical protein
MLAVFPWLLTVVVVAGAMKREGLGPTSPSCRSYWARLDARAALCSRLTFSSDSWVSALRSQAFSNI